MANNSMNETLETFISWAVENWAKIPDELRVRMKPEMFRDGSTDEREEDVILLLDRQKPSVEADWSFDEERIGINKHGEVIWGFDSGCSCPEPWVDNAPFYSRAKTWKEFVVNLKDFDVDVLESCIKNAKKIRAAVEVGV